MTTPPLSSAPFALALALACTAAVAQEAAPPVQVHWSDPAAFTEVRTSQCRSRDRSGEWLDELARHLRARAARALAPGQRLDITITDVRRAGECEPWRGAGRDDIRVIKDTYPPRIDLRYTLRAGDGSVVSEGENQLRDVAFLQRGAANRTDPLRYEKRLLDDWLRREFANHD
jgi:hypothetical protein